MNKKLNWDDINPIRKGNNWTGNAVSGKCCVCGIETDTMRLSQKLKNFVYCCTTDCEEKLNKEDGVDRH